jgi:hypothetical protein
VVVDDISTVDSSFPITEHVICGQVNGPVYRQRTKATPPDKQTPIKAACPKGTHVLGGGELAESAFPGAQRLVATAPYDSKDGGKAPDDGWRVRIDTLGQAGDHATAYAICTEVGGLHYLTRKFHAAVADSYGLQQCPQGQWVVGGGIDQGGPFDKRTLAINSFDVTHTAWMAKLHNDGSPKLTFAVTAICHK